MKANRLVPRRVQDALGHDQRHEGHHQQVRVERAELLEGLVALEGRRLAERYAQPERLGLERVGAAAGRVGRREDVDDSLRRREWSTSSARSANAACPMSAMRTVVKPPPRYPSLRP